MFDSVIDEQDFALEQKKKLRLEHLTNIFNWYSEKYLKSTSFEFVISTEEINNMYWLIVKNCIKVHFKNEGDGYNIDRHKIMSVIEFVIMGLKPINHKDASYDDIKKQNAHFAVVVAWVMYLSFYKYVYGAVPSNYKMAKFAEAHKCFLMYQNFTLSKSTTPPVLLSNLMYSNAATWFGIDQYILAKNDKI